MSDWKENLDSYLDEIKREEREEEKRKYQRRLQKYQKRYKCYICGKPSSGPKFTRYDPSTREKIEIPSARDFIGSKPEGLDVCNECGKWVCEEHYHRGICMDCAEKL